MGGRVVRANSSDVTIVLETTEASWPDFEAARGAPSGTSILGGSYHHATAMNRQDLSTSETVFDITIRRVFMDFDPPAYSPDKRVLNVSLVIGVGPILEATAWRSRIAVLGGNQTLPTPVVGDFDQFTTLYGEYSVDRLNLPPNRLVTTKLNAQAIQMVESAIVGGTPIKMALLEYDYDYNYTFDEPPPGGVAQGSSLYATAFTGPQALLYRPRLIIEYDFPEEPDRGRHQPELVRLRSPNGTEIYFEYPFELLHLGGLGLPPMSNQWSGSPIAPGGIFLDRRVLPRTLELSLAMWGRGHEDDSVWAKRQELFRGLSLYKDPMELDLCMYNGEVYTLKDVYVDAMTDSGLSYSGTPTRHTAQLHLAAMDPTWWGRTYRDILASTEDDTDLFAVDFTLVNEGTAPSYPRISVFGPCVDPIFSLSPTGGYLELEHTQLVNEFCTIETQPLRRTLRNQDEENIALSTDSTLGRFFLLPDPYTPGGVNSLSGVFEIDVAPTYGVTVQVDWADRWYGV